MVPMPALPKTELAWLYPSFLALRIAVFNGARVFGHSGPCCFASNA